MFALDIVCFAPAYQFDREMMRESAEAEAAIVTIAEGDDGKMQGFVIAHAESSARCAYIVTIDVAPKAQRTGVGSALIRQMEKDALASGLIYVALHVAVDNRYAIAFYERHGYQRDRVERRFYREAGQDGFFYVKYLRR